MAGGTASAQTYTGSILEYVEAESPPAAVNAVPSNRRRVTDAERIA